MVMDTGIRELSGMIDGFCLGDALSNQGAIAALEEAEDPESFFNHTGLVDPPLILPEVPDGFSVPPVSTSPQGFLEDSEIFSDIALSYISEMLMEEEEMDGRALLYDQEGPDLRDAVKPFYDVLGEQYPPPLDLLPFFSDSSASPEDSGGGHCSNSFTSSSPSGGAVEEGCLFEYPSPQVGSSSVDYSSQTSFGSSNGVPDGAEEALFRAAEEDFQIEMQQLWQYKKGVEEASKFLPDQKKLVIDLEAGSPLPRDAAELQSGLLEVKVEQEDKGVAVNGGARNRKNPHHEEDLDVEEGRSTKHSAVVCSDEDDVAPEMFDKVLLCPQGRPNDAISSLREALQSELESKAVKSNGHSKGGNGKSRGKRPPKKEVIDLRTLLIHCAQAVATDDRRSASEQLKHIRQHSSMDGDGSQRLAHCFADGLEARLAGTGVQRYHSMEVKSRSAAAILKAYHLYLAACPFKKVFHFVANQSILNAAEGATRLHIIDFGIWYGFQWPCLIQRLSLRPGGPPHLRITGVEMPQPGFRPAERVAEAGRRLADYARRFGVPFEYRPISARWEDIRVEELGIDREEVLVVNCLCKFKNLVDETVVVDSPRDRVLHAIRRMRPDLFIHGVVNGAYGAPFFVTRFREALFHFSALFDMLDATVPREHPERKLIEREIFGREAMNVIACEGSERVERPETYKQWQARNLRAGLVQVPLNRDITRKTRDKVRNCYHKDFLIDVDGGWLLQGWKGRITYALSTWRASQAGGF
ncbi:hypothetical protein Taro_047289 [Colocasia esculenta]|uniref:Scarecrow-like protein 9 n=1 Tax=Colocasia esculenta TaxID=4460 RepID=A0A843WSG9_COLES|nr:hypothetical protein [Colocasia esculenta]